MTDSAKAGTWPYPPYPPFDKSAHGLPSWECPGESCHCHPDDGTRVPHTIVLHDVHGKRDAGAKCRVYEGSQLLTPEPAEANGKGEVQVLLRPTSTRLRIEWAPANLPDHPRLPYRKHYYVRLGSKGAQRNARRLANLGFQKQRHAADNIRDYQRAYHQAPTGARAHVQHQVRTRHDDRQLPPFAPGVPPDTALAAAHPQDQGQQPRGGSGEAALAGDRSDVILLASGGGDDVLLAAAGGDNILLAGDDEDVDDTPTAGGSTVPNAAHLTIGVSDPPLFPALNPAQVRIRLRVIRIAAGAVTSVRPNTLLTPDVGNQTKRGAAFLFKHLPEGTYEALAFVISAGETVASQCGRLRITIGTGDHGGHKFVDMTVAPYQLSLVGPGTAIVGQPASVTARGTVGPITLWTSTPATAGVVVPSTPPLFMVGRYTAIARGSSVIEATDLGGQQAQLTIVNDCVASTLMVDRVLAIGTDSFLLKSGIKRRKSDPRLPPGHVLGFSNDSLHSSGRKIPHPPEASRNEAALKANMNFLLTMFAHEDKPGMARRLFNAFQAPNRSFRFYDDTDLNRICDTHPNLNRFIQRTLNAPSQPGFDPKKTGIHQQLAAVGFDVNTAAPVRGLQPPAVNRGKNPSLVPPSMSTEDRANGLFAMINGFQHAIAVAKDYAFDACKKQYEIELQFNFYDIFGLDDEDLREFGISARGWAAGKAVTSWWQLQHQFDYVPLITRVVLHRTFTIPAI